MLQLQEAGSNKELVLGIVRQLEADDALPSMTSARLDRAARVLADGPAGNKPALVKQLIKCVGDAAAATGRAQA